MTPSNATNERDALAGKVAFHRYMNAGLLGLSAVLAGGLVWTTVNSTVVVVPPEVRRPYEIGSSFGDRDYLADMATYVLSTVLTVSPDSVDHNNMVILRMTDPDGHGQLKAELEAAALRLKRDRVSTVWNWNKYEVSLQKKRVTMSGRLKTYIADVLTSERDKQFTVDFTITSSGRLYVFTIKELVKADPARPAGQPS